MVYFKCMNVIIGVKNTKIVSHALVSNDNIRTCCEICEVNKRPCMRGDRQCCEDQLMNCDTNEKYIDVNILVTASPTHRGNQGTCL